MISDQTSIPTTTLCSPTFPSSTHLIARCYPCAYTSTHSTSEPGGRVWSASHSGRLAPDTHRIGGWVVPRDGQHVLGKKGTHSFAGNRNAYRPLCSKVCYDIPYFVITCRADLPMGCGLPFAVPTRSFSVLHLNFYMHVLCD